MDASTFQMRFLVVFLLVVLFSTQVCHGFWGSNPLETFTEVVQISFQTIIDLFEKNPVLKQKVFEYFGVGKFFY